MRLHYVAPHFAVCTSGDFRLSVRYDRAAAGGQVWFKEKNISEMFDKQRTVWYTINKLIEFSAQKLETAKV
jgi:hypothetical protein